MKYPLTRGDIEVVPLQLDECEECVALATHEVRIDIRAAGVAYSEGRYCQLHATVRAEGIREALPDDQESSEDQQ